MNKQEMDKASGAEMAELTKKKSFVEKVIIESKFEKAQEQIREIEALKNFNLSTGNKEYIDKIANEGKEYLLKARDSGVFLNDMFKGKIPFFARNIILAAAETGSGKSTLSANISFTSLYQGKKVLVLTNEEHPSDVYNRISCLAKGWPYTDHTSFTNAQLEFFEKNTPALAERMMVVGDNFNGITGCTTTIEGIENVLNSLLVNGHNYDVIILDYYQNVDRSTTVADMVDWQVQYRLAKFLDQYKNRSGATIVILAQKKSTSKDKDLPFKEAIEGRKAILNVATCALDVVKDIENFRTGFTVKKSRFADSVGETIYVGFEKGRYVEWTQEFRLRAQDLKSNKEHKKLVGDIKPTGFNNTGDSDETK